MALPDKQFLKDLLAGEILASDKYWPQLDEILAMDSRHPFAVRDSMQLWKRASNWLYANPDTPWAPETEELFRLDFENNARDGNTRVQTKLLQTWLRYGTHNPSAVYRHAILSKLKDFVGFQWMQHAVNIASWASAAQQSLWLKEAQAQTKGRPTPTAYSMYVYMHGDISGLCPAQTQDASRHLRGETEDYPISFAQARVVATFHPQPEAWTAEIMGQAWIIAKYPGPDDLWRNAFEAIGHLDAMLDEMPWDKCTIENAHCLVTAALMEREGNLLNLDMSAWERRAPAAWAHTKHLLPLFEALNDIPAGPYDSGLAAKRLAPLVLIELQKMQGTPPQEMPVDGSVFAFTPNAEP